VQCQNFRGGWGGGDNREKELREKNYITKNITSQATLLANNSFIKAIYTFLIMPMFKFTNA